jgi:hypothetical protein
MPIELIEPPESETPEYLIVSDTNSEVIFSSHKENAEQPLAATIKLANFIRKAGGAVTIFKATKY